MARRFRFRLERLARVRAIEERLSRSLWSEAEGTARAAEEAAERVRTALREGRAGLGQELAGGAVDPTQVLVRHRVLAGLGGSLAARRQDSLTRRGQADRLAADWRERRARSEALGRLHVRAFERHRRAEDRLEALELDEIALARARRREAP